MSQQPSTDRTAGVLVAIPDAEVHDAMRLAERLGAEPGVRTVLGTDFSAAEAAVCDLARDAEVVAVGLAPVTRRVLDACPKLRLIVKCGIGMDHIDVAAAAEHDVLAVRTAGANFVGVAEYVLAAVLGHARRLDELSRATHQGEWDELRAAWAGRLPELRGQAIGLVGFGAIARHVATLASGFGMHVLAYDPFVGDEAVRAAGAVPATLEELLSGADVVSVHATLNDGNAHLLDRRLLGLMKPSALLVNTARGPLVDQAAVAELLVDGAIGGAVLDVLEQEPPDPGDPILTAPNCVITPHLAGCTEDGYVEIGQVAARLVHEFVAGRPIAEHHVVRPRGH